MAVFSSIAIGSIYKGMTFMFLFGLGTVPLMTSIIYFGQWVDIKWKRRIKKSIPLIVIAMGVLFILRGLGLGIPYISPKPVLNTVNSFQDCFKF